jgi:predicted PurR-regulated permease PerM
VPDDDVPGADEHVPLGLRVAAAWSWRVLVVVAAVAVVVLAVARLQLLTLAIFVALLLTALLSPLHRRLVSWGWPRWLATTATVVGLVLVVLGLGALIGGSIANEWGTLSVAFQDGLDDIRSWLADGPLHASDSQIDQWLESLQQSVKDNQGFLVSGALSTAVTAAEVGSGALLAVFSTIFFLHDGRGIATWVVRLFPSRVQPDAVDAGDAAWTALTGYVRGTVIIAAVDAVSIGIVLTILRVPLALPLAVLVFFGAFVPIVGAFVTGFIAVVVALATQGVWTALIVLAAILAVQQVEGHVLQPVVMGRMVRLHPLAVVFAVTAGSVLAGIVGAVVAVPLVAVVNVVIRRLRDRGNDAAPPPDDGGPVADADPVGPEETGSAEDAASV